MNTDQAKSLDLPKIMSRLGHEPVRSVKGGRELWYKSPFRSEEEPSFHTSFLGGKWIWNDFADQGGTVIDFIMRHEGYTSVTDALNFLTSMFQGHLFDTPVGRVGGKSSKLSSPSLFSFQQQARLDGVAVDRDFSEATLELVAVKPLQSPLIFSYLASRGISRQLAQEYLKLVQYRNHKRPSAKPYFAFGQENVSGGWEIRSASDGTGKFKSALVCRDITVHSGREEGRGAVSVFEGMLDHLSLLTMFGTSRLKGDAIIMNALSSYQRTKTYIEAEGYTRVDLFLDNNTPGQEAAHVFADDFGDIVFNHSPSFAPHTDLNDALRAGAHPDFTPRSSPEP
ncbi:Toprim domain-containing protein [Neolewinella xylanilytica]|uniref:Toprim domain-containing protein n=1 Tax=Neolewinella xylanilytica TaxID=1514080 RepID=A0A2S6I006_9BACT|nr:toprim domain-containing protein [Neolewinella xylanilytica]PPK83924.1 Toprim domain-containing protein [Neolewinella xylanilytica]